MIGNISGLGTLLRFAITAVTAVVAASGCAADQSTLTLGIPTTIQDSGLLDALLPKFQGAHPRYHVKFVGAGSGELLSLGARGDLDVLLAHAPRAEERFMAEGHGRARYFVMQNDFVLVGPPSDPARIRGLTDASEALAEIARTGETFLSRGDESGTHQKERALWAATEVGAGAVGYRELGQGMGAVLRAASELGAYTLTDRATFRNLSETLELVVLVEGDPRLLNVYHVIVVSSAREVQGAEAFAAWLTSDEGRRAISEYGVERFGQPLFRPASG